MIVLEEKASAWKRNMTKVKFINHSSILVDDRETIILTDPWLPTFDES